MSLKPKTNLAAEEIINLLRTNKNVLEKYKIKRIGLFGSYVRGEQKKKSDIDLVVEFDLPAFGKDFEGLFDIFMDLSSYLFYFGVKWDIVWSVIRDKMPKFKSQIENILKEMET